MARCRPPGCCRMTLLPSTRTAQVRAAQAGSFHGWHTPSPLRHSKQHERLLKSFSFATSCSAGTALGDPIELGAALAALRRSDAPLRLAAAKSRVGHSEPVSGTVGLTHAAAQLAQASSSAVMHLRSFNPLLVSIAQTHVGSGWAAPWAPRQAAPGQQTGSSSSAAQQGASGISAFAFQGTNAHAVLVRGSSLPAGQRSISSQWQRRRFWFAAPPHILVGSMVEATPAVVRLQAALQAPALSYLWDHQVQGQVLLPGAAMFEAAAAVGRLMLAGLEAAAVPVLAAVTIPAPCVLPAHGSGAARGPVLTSTVKLATGRLTLQSSAAAHLTGVVGHSLAERSTTGDTQQTPADSCCRPGLFPLACITWCEEAASQPPPSAVACVQEDVLCLAGQYNLHPAVIDNATQASVDVWEQLPCCTVVCFKFQVRTLSTRHCLLQASSALSTGGEDNLVRVPAGVEALALPATAASQQPAQRSGQYTVSAAVISREQHGAARCSYHLAAAQATEGSMHLSGMLFKPLGGTAKKTAGAAHASGMNAVEAGQLLYAVAWEASSSMPDGPHGPAMQHSLEWSIGKGSMLRMHAGSNMDGLASLQNSLGLLQCTTSSRARPAVLLSSQLNSSGPTQSSPAHAAAAGLLRVAARESSGQHFAHLLHHTCAAQTVQLPEDGPDLFGVGLAGKWGRAVYACAHCAWLPC